MEIIEIDSKKFMLSLVAVTIIASVATLIFFLARIIIRYFKRAGFEPAKQLVSSKDLEGNKSWRIIKVIYFSLMPFIGLAAYALASNVRYVARGRDGSYHVVTFEQRLFWLLVIGYLVFYPVLIQLYKYVTSEKYTNPE